MYAMVLGFPGCGKSHFFESCDDALILNFDLTSTSNPEPSAVTWPQFNDEGVPIDGAGSTYALSWPKTMEIVDQLIKLAAENKPRPQMVVFDSLSTMIPLICEWTPEGLPFSSTTGKTFQALDGKMAWGFVFTTITNTASKLRQAGYGVWFVGHTMREEKKDKQGNIVETKTVPTFSNGIWKRLAPQFELVATISKKKAKQKETVSEKIPGRTKERTRTLTKDVTTYTLGFSITDLKDYYKARVYPEVELPPTGGWQVFRDAYLQALQDCQKPASQKES